MDTSIKMKRVDLRSRWIQYSKFLLRWGWFVLLTIILAITITKLTPDAASTSVYQASLQVQISLPNGSGVIAQTNAATFFSNLMASPSTLSLAVPKLNKLPQFQSLDLSSLQSLVTASTVTGINVIQLNAISDTPQDATIIANNVYQAFLETVHFQRSTVIDGLRTSLNSELKKVNTDLSSSSAQLQNLSLTGQTGTFEYHYLTNLHAEELHFSNTINSQLSTLNQQGFVSGNQDILQLVKPQPNITTIPAAPGTQGERLAMAPIVGLLMGLAGALLANRFSNSLPLRGKKREMILPYITSIFPILPNLQANRLTILQQASAQCQPLLRHLRYQASEHEKRLRLITVISPKRREGKSTIATSLAIASVQNGLRTLLVDANPRTPVLHTWFRLANTIGTIDSVRSLEKGMAGPSPIVATSITKLGLVPIGHGNPKRASTMVEEPLQIDGLRPFIELLSNQADLIVFDGPSLLSDTEAINLASLSDVVLLIVDAQRSKSTEVLEAETLLSDIGVSFVTILNRATRELVD